MPELMDEQTKTKLIQALSHMEDPVELLLFTEKVQCPTCHTQQEILEAVTTLSDKLGLKVFNSQDHQEELERYTIDHFPATVPLGTSNADHPDRKQVDGQVHLKDYGIRFFGITGGEEFASFLQTIIMVSTGHSELTPELETLVRDIEEPVHIQVFVTLTCPYCPKMVHAAHQFAYVNENIRADMIEASQFPELAMEYQVESVPKTVINETTMLEGTHPEAILYLAILQAVDLAEYRRIEAAMRDMEGVRKITPLDELHLYDVVIIGGGPAAMSAALYAARKNLDVGLVAGKIGGQMRYTARIENYLGFPGVGGDELLERFQFHMESYPLSELLDIKVTAVEKRQEGFTIHTDDGRRFKAHCVIYCTGKEYNRLGVPNEERFLGHGIAFCATCDAPLYTDRTVAVVGGANSAFTAVRDLLSFAEEIHLIHRKETFTADEALVEKIKGNSKVKFHTPYQVVSFIGDERLTGITIYSPQGNQVKTLEVEGVFLEIGLSPNTKPVKELVKLNQRAEVPVNPDRSTEVPGFFAAGDVTDVSEKQISVAVGDGALAALAAYKYLVDKKLVEKKAGTDDDWW